MTDHGTSFENHPRYASSFIGHNKVISHLQHTHKEGKLPHGLLFVGPKGIGKATLAYQVAAALLKDSVVTLGQPVSDLTPTDHLIRAGHHPDCVFIEKTMDDKGKLSKDISVDKARSVVHFFSQTSLENNWRIAIIDSVDDLTPKGANSLLKILEEPPHKCLLILISHNLEGVLPTLRSRAQIIPLQPLSQTETSEVLQSKNLEKPEFLSTVSAGRPGLGLMIHDLGGASFYEAFLTVMKDLAQNDLRSTHAFALTFIFKNTSLPLDLAWKNFFDFLTYWLSSALIQVQRKDRQWGTTHEAPIAQALFAKRSPDQWVQSWFYIQDLLRATHTYSLDKKQALLCIFHELAGLHQR